MSKPEMHKGVLIDRQDTEKVVILTFLENNKEFKASANKAVKLPDLKMNEEYSFGVEYYQNYTNLAPIWRNKERVGYEIHPISPDFSEPVKAPLFQDKSHPANAELNKAPNREIAIIRESCLSTAGQMVSIANSEGIDEATEAVLKIAKRFEKYVKEGI